MAQARSLGLERGCAEAGVGKLPQVRAMMEGKLAPTEERLPLGTADVRAMFGSGSRMVAGCMVTEGAVRKEALAVVRALSPALPSHVLAGGMAHARDMLM